MFKHVADRVWAFDAEWVPDPKAGRLLYQLPEEMPDQEVVEQMWLHGGASEEDPTPFLKTTLCRVVSVAAVVRHAHGREVTLNLLALPREGADGEPQQEAHLLHTFLNAIGEHKPQLVGFNSGASDLKILLQRALINGVSAGKFCERPNKPWEGIDYFARGDAHVDIKEIVGGWGKMSPSLHELAVLSGIPGKMDVDGNQVAELWLQGELPRIVAYNEFDALTTYLVWLRLAHMAGHFTDAGYDTEQQRLRALIEQEMVKPGREHLQDYMAEWQRLREATGQAMP